MRTSALIALSIVTATLTGIPSSADVGDHAITLQVQDASGAKATQTFTLTVAARPPVILTVFKSGDGSGTVTSDLAGINCGLDCSQSHAYGDTIILTAQPDGGQDPD